MHGSQSEYLSLEEQMISHNHPWSKERQFGMGPTLDHLIMMGLIETAGIVSYYISNKADRNYYMNLAYKVYGVRVTKR